ncbi:MAG: AAA family ATPase, partial [Planctomycetes bacterium]|nr:AAA family ATPase [Planctomycetota bacterium]
AADRAGARGSAHRHLELAAALQFEANGPHWLVLCGPPASGKSSLANALHELAGWPHVATDVVRKQLAGLDPHEPARPEHYSEAFSRRTYAALHERAAAATAAGAKVVLLDGNFPTPAHRAAVAAAARSSGAAPTFVHVAVDPATAATRAAARRRDPANVSDADPAVTAARHASFVPPLPAEGHAVLAVDGRRPVAAILPDLLADCLRP